MKPPEANDDGKPPFPPQYPAGRGGKKEIFAMRFMRLVYKLAVGHRYGCDVVALLGLVVTTEDKTYYRRGVAFYNLDIQNILGFKRDVTLARVRKVAMDAGWLHYHPSPNKGDRKPGTYWVQIPSDADGVTDPLLDDSESSFTDDATAETVDIDEPQSMQSVMGGEGVVLDGDTPHEMGSVVQSVVGSVMGSVMGYSPKALLPTPTPNTKSGEAASPPAPKSLKRPVVVNATAENPSAGIPLPSCLDSPEFREAWRDWVNYRIETKAKLTETAVKMQFKKCAGMGVTRAIAMIEHTIASTWTGLREPEENGNGKLGQGATRTGGSRGTVKGGPGTDLDPSQPGRVKSLGKGSATCAGEFRAVGATS